MASKQLRSFDRLLSRRLGRKNVAPKLGLHRGALRRKLLGPPSDAGIIVAKRSIETYRAEIAKIK